MDGDKLMNEGFYKLDGTLLYAVNYVKNKDYELLREQKDSYSYPVHGWYWCDTLEEACALFGLNISDYETPADEITE